MPFTPVRSTLNFFKRNLAFSNSYVSKLGAPMYNNWKVAKAVKDGMKSNSWVYRAVTLTSKSVGSVPWHVEKDGEPMEDHHLTKLFRHPNDFLSRQDCFELLSAWLELGGQGYYYRVVSGGKTVELWPVSPDRLTPVASKDIDKWIEGYRLDIEKTIKYKFEDNLIIHFRYFNPADPYTGLGPLQAVGKTVDTDNDMINWAKSTMQNMGIPSLVFSFKRNFTDQDQADKTADRLNERWAGSSNARRIGAVGSEAKIEKLSFTPQEMDFNQSRKDNRDEIFITFGIPPQYAGAQESSTYNNYATSELIFWFQKVIPILDDMKDTLNFMFRKTEELKDGEELTYSLVDVPAIRRAYLERSKTAKNFFDMGVPFDKVNKAFKFGIEEFDGWEKSYVKVGKQNGNGTEGEVRKRIADKIVGTFDERHGVKPGESRIIRVAESPFTNIRDIAQEAVERESWATTWAKEIDKLLVVQGELILKEVETKAYTDGRSDWIEPEDVLHETYVDWEPVYRNISLGIALKSAGNILIQERQSFDDQLKQAVEAYLENERTVLIELSLIEASTVDQVLNQVRNAVTEGMSANELQNAIIDAGIFDEVRALRLARTITGSAASVGQLGSASHSGATHKSWVDSGFEVRDIHVERSAEPAVSITARFSSKLGQLTGPMYPLDPILIPADRVNCRCGMTFEIR